MFCPEGYFTPKMLEGEFARSLARKSVREAVFASAGQSASDIPSAHLDEVLSTAAALFLNLFIQANSSNVRACNALAPQPVRFDPWWGDSAELRLVALPVARTEAEAINRRLNAAFALVDQELWVIDCTRVSEAAQDNATHKRIAVLTQNFDGWSLCFPDSEHPNDVGTAMNNFAKQMAIERASVPIAAVMRGRPTKVGNVARYIQENWPDGYDEINRGVMLREVEKGMAMKVSPSTLSNALRNIQKIR